MKKLRFFTKRAFWIVLITIGLGYLLPNPVSSPITENKIQKVDSEAFWHYPWGESGVHKGIDIFCDKGTELKAPIYGIVIKKGYGRVAGNYIYILGPKWRMYYFAHLDTIICHQFDLVKNGEILGRVGNTGNAAYKPSHLHYSIETLFPYFWEYDKKEIHGWQKTFYLDPNKHLGF